MASGKYNKLIIYNILKYKKRVWRKGAKILDINTLIFYDLIVVR